jgi:anti-anti-sigma factor
MSAPRTFSVSSENDTLIMVPLRNVGSLGEEDTKPELDAMLDQLKRRERQNVVVDFAKVSYFGTAMLKAMHAIWRHVRDVGGRMAVCNVSDMGRAVLHVSRFDTLWPVCASRSEAVEEVTGSPGGSEG